MRAHARALPLPPALVAITALLLVVGGGTVAGVGAQSVGGPVPGSLQQAYTPGLATASVIIPSQEIPGYAGDLLSVQAVDVGNTAAEPTIGVDKDGTAFYAASTLLVDTAVVYGVAATDVRRSDDGGKTWSSVQLKVPVADRGFPPGNADPFVWVDQDTGRVFNIDLYAGCSWLNFSDDKGKTWLANPAACGNYVNDHQTITAGKPRGGLVTVGYPNVLYYCFNRVADANCGRSLDGGLTWTPTPQPSFVGYDQSAGGLCGGLHGHARTDAEGRLFIPKGHCGKPYVGISEDSGNSWKRVKVSDLGAQDTHLSIAADKAGNLYMTWVHSTSKLVLLSVSKDNGNTWGPAQVVSPPGVTEANLPVVTAGDAGRIALNFVSSTSPTKSGSTRPWNQTIVVSANALDAQPTYLSATANNPADPIHRGTCAGRCGGMWDFIDITNGPDGAVWAAASDDCVATCVTGTATALKVGRGLAIKQVGGPFLKAAAAG